MVLIYWFFLLFIANRTPTISVCQDPSIFLSSASRRWGPDRTNRSWPNCRRMDALWQHKLPLNAFHTCDVDLFSHRWPPFHATSHTHKGNIQIAHRRVSTWPTCTLNVAFIFCKCRRDFDSALRRAREPPSKTFTFLIEAKAVTLKSWWCPAGQDISAFWTSAALQNGNTILTAIFLLRMQNKLSHLLLTHRFIKQDYERSTSSGYFSVFSIPRFFRSFWSTSIYVHCLQLEGKHNTCMFLPFCSK